MHPRDEGEREGRGMIARGRTGERTKNQDDGTSRGW